MTTVNFRPALNSEAIAPDSGKSLRELVTFRGGLYIPSHRPRGVAEDGPDQFGETCFGTNIVREDQDATLTGLNADHGVRSSTVVPAFVEIVALRAVENDNTYSSGTFRLVEAITVDSRNQLPGSELCLPAQNCSSRHF
jgi:hypothetical protein